jgi:beta-lactamase superfamily II metal-dependent hydrolase
LPLPNNPPDHDELELSVFGPGFGEAIAIHLGCGEWAVVDTLVDERHSTLLPLEYLQGLGVDARTSVKLVVGTHFDMDHVMGLAQTVEHCTEARFVTSLVLREPSVLTLIRANSQDARLHDRIADEYARTIAILMDRSGPGRPQVPPITWAGPDVPVWLREESNNCPGARVTALSPSHASVTMTVQALGNLAPELNGERRATPWRTPNHSSVVIWAQVGETSVLLGSDLEETGHPGTGWSAICDSITRPAGRAEVFKVPHHGSAPADQPRVWAELLDPEVRAVLTAWKLGSGQLPRASDIRRLCEEARDVYLTSPPVAPASLKREASIEKTMKESVLKISALSGQVGHVRMRKRCVAGATWQIELDDPADSVCAPTRPPRRATRTSSGRVVTS